MIWTPLQGQAQSFKRHPNDHTGVKQKVYPTNYRLVIDVVSKNFHVVDVTETPAGLEMLVSKVGPEKSRRQFKRIADELIPRGYVPKLLPGKPYLRLIVFPTKIPSRRSKIVYLAMLIATIVTVTFSGYLHSKTAVDILSRIGITPRINTISSALMFTASVFFALGTHEFGHMVATKIKGGDWEPPMFIPGGPPLGTFGAIIFGRRMPINRDELFDMGLSGPLTGLLASIPVCYFGIKTSIPLDPSLISALQKEGARPLWWEQPIFTYMFKLAGVPEGKIVYLSPVALAGWVILTVTFFNLMPVSQLDGGHVCYAFFPDERIRRFIAATTVITSFLFLRPEMAFLLLIFTLFVRHPPPLDEYSSLSKKRIYLGAILYIITLIVTFPLTPELRRLLEELI
ncbi:MAG TPA: site-2 protease family protein [Candidatus Korarchaeota archaeon]|nr:site-2 protease family protein [Candidatus Korarchaeota archaeon]